MSDSILLYEWIRDRPSPRMVRFVGGLVIFTVLYIYGQINLYMVKKKIGKNDRMLVVKREDWENLMVASIPKIYTYFGWITLTAESDGASGKTKSGILYKLIVKEQNEKEVELRMKIFAPKWISNEVFTAKASEIDIYYEIYKDYFQREDKQEA